MPHIADPYFGKSVVLLCDHTTEGAMGVVVNRPISDPELKKLFSEIYEKSWKFSFFPKNIF